MRGIIMRFLIVSLLVLTTNLFATIINVPDDFDTIQEAIDGAEDGDTVLVEPGRYVNRRPVNFDGKDIVVGSLFLTTGDEDYIAETIIDGDEYDHVVMFISEETRDAQLVGFTIQNGFTNQYGGGIMCDESSPTLRDLIIVDNVAVRGGGGIDCYNQANPELRNVRIEGNRATGNGSSGGGISCWENSNLTLTDVTINENAAGIYGGGIYCHSSELTLTDVTVNLNRTTRSGHQYGGGGLYCYGSELTLTNTIIMNNASGGYGGGIYCRENSSIALENVTISGDTARYLGGGIYSTSSTLTLTNTHINGNVATSYGGGIYLSGGEQAVFTRTTLSNNEARDYGGGIYCSGSSPELTNATMYGNSAENGSALYLSNGSEPVLVNTIIWNHESPAIFFPRDGNPNSLTISYSDCDFDEDNIRYRDQDELNWGAGMINGDPLFLEPEEGDFHLTQNSPCIDAGNPRSPEDPDGTRADMGAYYYYDRGDELTVSLADGWNLISINVSPSREFYNQEEDRGPDIELMMEQLRIDEDNHHVILYVFRTFGTDCAII